MTHLKAVVFAFLLSLVLAPARAAEENRYDLLAKVINPLMAPFARQTPNPNRSLEADLSLIAMTGVPPEFLGTKIHLAVQHPDKIYLQAPILGQQLALCRNEKDIWIYPGAKADALLSQFAADTPKKKVRLGNLELPFTQAQLVFLPALFQVKEYQGEVVNGVTCRILELNLIPEIAQSLGVEQWLARFWVGPDYKIAKLEVLKPGWHIVVGVDKLAFSPSLPGATFQPTPEQAPETTHLKAAQLLALLEAIAQSMGSMEK